MSHTRSNNDGTHISSSTGLYPPIPPAADSTPSSSHTPYSSQPETHYATQSHPSAPPIDYSASSSGAGPSSSMDPALENRIPASTLRLEQIVRPSRLYNIDPTIQMQNIVAEFNRGNKEDFTEESIPFGKRIGTDQFRLVHRNNVPQLVPYTFYPRRLGIYATGTIQEIGIFKQTDLLIGAHGRYLVNVPQGQLVKAWEGMNPIFLSEGPHVIRHQNFRLDKNPTVNISDNVIHHGNFAIIRVPRGKLAKITLNGTPHLLEASQDPYVFNDPTFKLIPQSEEKNDYFIDASDQLIQHGSIKRIMPRTGEVAIAYNNGNLVAIKAQEKPIIIDSPTFSVDGFLKINRQTLVFPSDETQEQRRKNNPKDLDAIQYEVFRTSDGLPIGVQLLVAYEIENPQLALEKLNKDDIKTHIENVVVAHMLSVIQSCTSADFQKSGQNAVKEPEHPEHKDIWDIFQMPSEPSPFYSQLNKDTQQLANDLLKIGIRITQLRLEPPKILDAKIANEMAQNSLLNATARAKVSVLGLNSEITSQEAKQSSEQLRIKTERDTQNKITQAQAEAETIKIKAQAELDAARLRAEATRIEYENTIRKTQMENQLRLEQMKQQAELFAKYPGLLNLEMTRIQGEAMKGIQSVVSPEIAAGWFNTPGLGLFSNLQRKPLTGARPELVSDNTKKSLPEPESTPTFSPVSSSSK